jgi:pyruvate formate lyase activating enzyme
MITDEESCRHCFACTDVCPADAREIIGRRMTVGEVMAEVKKDVPFYDESGGGVTFSGGEPLAQPEFLLELLDACGRIDLHGTVDTSGYAKKEILLQVADKTDLFLYDLKHMDPDLHLQYTGVGNEVILDNLKALSCRDVAFRVRFPLIPGINDDPKNVESMAAFLQKLHRVCSIDILPYHDVATSKYQRFGYTYRLAGVRAPDAARLQEVAATLSSHGLCVTIGGTDHEPANSQSQKSEPRSQAVHIP